MKQLIVLALFLAAACGPKSKPTETTTPGGGGEVAAAEPMTPERWESMDGEARAGYMKEVVAPKMTTVLQEFPEFQNEEINCKTCHGEKAEQGEFKMPNPDLPVLTAAMVQNPDADHQAIVDFMKQRVTPSMAELLGRPTWSPETPDGFGCGGCHTFQE